jgi:predicted nucleic acid-binding protein
LIFADSSYLVALWNPDDPYHCDACVIEKRLRERKWARGLEEVATCLPMAWEVAEGISRARGSQEGAVAFAKVINSCHVTEPTLKDVQMAFDRTFRVYVDLPKKSRRPGMIDSIGVAVMRRLNLGRIVSFDAGFDLIPDIRRVRLVRPGGDALVPE